MLYTLTYRDLDYDEERQKVWGLLGRFAWKYNDSPSANPFVSITAESDRAGENWVPLQAGLFRGSYERFNKIVEGYREVLNGLYW